MTDLLLPEVARVNLSSLQRKVKKDRKSLLPDAVADMIFCGGLIARVIGRFWKALQIRIDHGCEGRQAAWVVKEIDTISAECLELFGDIEQLAIETGLPIDELVKLEEFSKQIREIQVAMTPLRKLLDGRPPSIDPATLTACESSEEGQGYETGEAILTRLEQGGVL